MNCQPASWETPSHCHDHEWHETGEQKAKRIVMEETRRRRWEEADLRSRRKGDKGKAAVAHRLRQETTMSLKRIAERLQMGSWTYGSYLLNGRGCHWICIESEG